MSLIFFGCWGDYKYRVKEVLFSVYKYIKRNDVTNVIVAGDNYYIDKDKKKQKKYIPGDASSIIGLLHLATMDVHTDVLAGNHEYDRIDYSKIIGDYKHELSDGDDECFILQEEQNAFDRINNENFNFSTIHSDADKSFLLLNDVLYLFLDSSMYEYNLPECYASHDKNNERILGDLQQKQIEKMHEILKINARKYKKITVCAHHPLFIFRVKEGEYKDPT